MVRPLRIATRGSLLALRQTELVADGLRQVHPALAVELVTTSTSGDRDKITPLMTLGQGVFVKGVEDLLLSGAADIAVHSMKDVPIDLTLGLDLAAFPIRADARDALMVNTGAADAVRARGIAGLPEAARIGTGSPRRAAQLLALRSDLQILPIRGNLDTRIRKLRDGEFDAIVVAVAGVTRLGRLAELDYIFDAEVCTPAVGQGALVVQCRADDREIRDRVEAVDDPCCRAEVSAERAFLAALGGGCQVSAGALARLDGENLELIGVVASPDGRRLAREAVGGKADDPWALGHCLASRLLPAAHSLMGLVDAVPSPNVSGRVVLVGAGPGDPGLITVRGLECIQWADVVVYDRLAAPQLLNRARPDAELIYVGKGPGRRSLSQDEINRLLVEQAGRGRNVVRLKGGDPFVFGRGGEEGLALAAANVPFEVVPGVTSAIAAASSAGIPVTHRGMASSFTVVTGHEDATKPDSAIRWQAVASGADTLVFLMGVEHLDEIVANLLRAGRNPAEPAAVIRWGTTPQQEVAQATLGGIVQLVRERGVQPPAVLVIGDVVELRESLDWRSRLPLAGLRVLVTRAREQASQLSARLRELGASPIEYPTIEIKPLEDPALLDAALQDLPELTWVILTSVNGVASVFERLSAIGKDARAFAGVRICAIGPATATALANHGIRADLVPDRFVSESIVDSFRRLDLTDARILLARADIAPAFLSDELRRLGADVRDVVAYQTAQALASREALLVALEAEEVDLVTLTSSSTVRNLVDGLGDRRRLLDGVAIASIGPVTSSKAHELGLRVDAEATEHTIDGLVSAITSWRLEVSS